MARLRRVDLLLLTLLSFACAAVPVTDHAAEQPKNQVQVERLLVAVQSALGLAQKRLAFQKMPLLKSVTLNLTAEAKREVGGKISLYVVSLGGKRGTGHSQEIEITLTPPPPDSPHKVSASDAAVTDALVDSIVSAALGVRDAGKDAEFPLVFSALKVVLAFEVKTDGSAGAKFEILPVGFDLSGGLSGSATQKISVLYQNPETKQ